MIRVGGRAAVLVLAGLVAVAGCGYANPTPRDAARATAESFIQSCAREQPARASDLMSEPLRVAFLRSGSAVRACARFLGVDPSSRSPAELIRAFRATRVERVTLHGGSARITVRAPGAASQELGLDFSEGEWRLESTPAAA